MDNTKTTAFVIITVLLAVCLPKPVSAEERNYHFEGKISQKVLQNYLSRAVTFTQLFNVAHTERVHGSVDDNLRFLKNIGAKFVGRSIYVWGGETYLATLFAQAAPLVKKIHQFDPDIIVQGAVFEIVTTQVNQIPIPPWVFEDFDLQPQKRNFNYQAMLYPDGQGHDNWRKDASIPDMSQLETRLWFYYVSATYINLGFEAVHYGQAEIMDNHDPHHTHWFDLLTRLRRYASVRARRKMVLCDAHVPSGGIVENGKLLFDFHCLPLRIDEVPDQPGHGVLKVGYRDSIYQRSKGGLTPSGWQCSSLPYLVELDNWGSSGKGGQNIGAHWCWGYDEISWFAHQPEAYRNQWLRYAWKWIRQTDPVGFLEMPGSRTLADPVGKIRWYYANTRSEKVPFGFNQEETIKSIWQE